jgi:EF hand
MNTSYALAGFLALSTSAALVQAQTPAATITRVAIEAQIKANFARSDTNRDGGVTRAEAAAGRKLAMDAQFGAQFNALDADKNGSISRAEFIEANARALNAAIAEQGAAEKAFAADDLNRDGKVTYAEAASRPLREFDALDTNHDGNLTVAERQAGAKAKAARK